MNNTSRIDELLGWLSDVQKSRISRLAQADAIDQSYDYDAVLRPLISRIVEGEKKTGNRHGKNNFAAMVEKMAITPL